MASINNATREIVCKIVYYGPGMSGKTTNLQLIHRGLPEGNRGQLVSLDTHQERTLFFDFLPIDLGTIEGYQTKFQLYTVPGQTYYNATRKLVLRGVDGIVFVADSQPGKGAENAESWTNLKENLAEYGYRIEDIPHVLQYNKQDVLGAVSIRDMDAALNPQAKVPSLGAVACEGKGVKDTLKIVASGVLDRLRLQISGLASVKAAASSLATARAGAAVLAAADRSSGSACATPPPRLRARSLHSQAPLPEGPARRRLIDPALVQRERPFLRRRPGPETPPPALPPEPPPPCWEVEHPCDVHWRGFKIGRGTVHIEPRQNLDHEGAYRVEAQLRLLGLLRRSLSGPAEPTNPQRAGHGARLLLSGANGHGPEALVEPTAPPKVWMRVGQMRLVPMGEPLSEWPDDARLMPPGQGANRSTSQHPDEVTDHVPARA